MTPFLRPLFSAAAKVRLYAMADQIDTILHGAGLALPGQRETAWTRLRRFLRDAAS